MGLREIDRERGMRKRHREKREGGLRKRGEGGGRDEGERRGREWKGREGALVS